MRFKNFKNSTDIFYLWNIITFLGFNHKLHIPQIIFLLLIKVFFIFNALTL